MYNNQTISVVIPAYNEEKAISHVIKDFKKLGFIDQIIVIDNNSTDSTKEIAEKLGAKVVSEKKQGYGYACIRGLKEANTDLVVLVEGDSTFDAGDLKRLLKEIDKFDSIIGRRTTKGWYTKQANMSKYIRVGNYFLGKLMLLLFKTNLNDIGCTYRVIRNNKLKLFVDKLKIGGSNFTPELTIESIKAELKIKQIPIKYRKRIGETKLSMNWIYSLRIGIAHGWLIIKKRFF